MLTSNDKILINFTEEYFAELNIPFNRAEMEITVEALTEAADRGAYLHPHPNPSHMFLQIA